MSQPLVMDQVFALVMEATMPPEFAPRDSRWGYVRKIHLMHYPKCMACGSDKNVEVHHIQPYHLYPDLELDPHNLLTLCNHPTRLCHFRIGHGFNWKLWNPHVTVDADRSLQMLRNLKER